MPRSASARSRSRDYHDDDYRNAQGNVGDGESARGERARGERSRGNYDEQEHHQVSGGSRRKAGPLMRSDSDVYRRRFGKRGRAWIPFQCARLPQLQSRRRMERVSVIRTR